MGVLTHVLVHTASSLAEEEGEGEEVEGQGELLTVEGPDFDCLLQLPQSASTRPYGRQLTSPAVLFEDEDVAGDDLTVIDEMRLVIEAPELATILGGPLTEWLVDGDPEPLAPPGEVIGYQAKLKRVKV